MGYKFDPWRLIVNPKKIPLSPCAVAVFFCITNKKERKNMILIMVLIAIYVVKEWYSQEKSMSHRSGVQAWFPGLTVIMGAPGTGKSQLMAKLSRELIRKGIPVWSTEPIIGTYKVDLREDLLKYKMENGYLIIDEAGIYVDGREWADFAKNQIMFFKLHRHLGMKVIVLSQDKGDADKKIRDLATNIWVLKKIVFKRLIVMQRYSIDVRESEDKSDIIKVYDRIGLLLKGFKIFIATNKDRAMYDTHTRPNLPEKEWEKYRGGEQNYNAIIEQFEKMRQKKALQNQRENAKLNQAVKIPQKNEGWEKI